MKITIAVSIDKCKHWDFGNFKSKMHITVDKKLYEDYLQKRYDYEKAHYALIRKAVK